MGGGGCVGGWGWGVEGGREGEYLEGLIMLPVSALENNFNPRAWKTAGAKTYPSPVRKGLPAENPQQQLIFQEPVEEAVYTPTQPLPLPLPHPTRLSSPSKNNKNLKQNANDLPSTEQAAKTQPKQDVFFFSFQPFICCLGVVLWLDKRDFPRKSAYCVSVLK